MIKGSEKKPFNKKVTHIAIVVNDAAKTIKKLESYGIGPFKPVKAGKNSPPPVMYKGKPMAFQEKSQEYVGQIGGIGFEIFEVGPEDSPWREFLDKHGECIHHIGFEPDNVADIDKEVNRFRDAGADVLFTLKTEDGTGGGAYIDLGVGGLIFDFFLPPKKRD